MKKLLLLLLSMSSFFSLVRGMNVQEFTIQNEDEEFIALEDYKQVPLYIILTGNQEFITFGDHCAIVEREEKVIKKKEKIKPTLRTPDDIIKFTTKILKSKVECKDDNKSLSAKSILNKNSMFNYEVEVKTAFIYSEFMISRNRRNLNYLINDDNIVEKNGVNELELDLYLQSNSLEHVLLLFVRPDKTEIIINTILDALLLAIYSECEESLTSAINEKLFEALLLQENIGGFEWAYNTYLENVENNNRDIVNRFLNYEISCSSFLKYIGYLDDDDQLIDEKIDDFYQLQKKYNNEYNKQKKEYNKKNGLNVNNDIENESVHVNFKELLDKVFTLKNILKDTVFIELIKIQSKHVQAKKDDENDEHEEGKKSRDIEKQAGKVVVKEEKKKIQKKKGKNVERELSWAQRNKKPLSIGGITSAVIIAALIAAKYSGILETEHAQGTEN